MTTAELFTLPGFVSCQQHDPAGGIYHMPGRDASAAQYRVAVRFCYTAMATSRCVLE